MSPPVFTRPAGERGFTLLEIMVSLVLFVLLMAAVHQSVRAVSRAAEAVDEATGKGEELRAVTAFLQRSLSATVPVLYADGERVSLLFEGGTERLAFVTLLPVLAGFAGPSEAVLGMSDSGDALQLSYRPLERERAGDFGLGDYRTRTLGAEVAEVRFSYFGATAAREEPAWAERWRDTRRLPLLVRLSVRLRDGASWPDIVVRLHTTNGPVLRRQASLDGGAPYSLAALSVDSAGLRP